MHFRKSIFLLSLIGCLFLSSSVFAAQWGDFTYTVSDSDNITITGYTGAGGAVEIPDTINGMPVISIGDVAFEGRTDLTGITIPGSVTSFGLSVFGGCTGLKSVTIENGVTSIGAAMFSGCTGLTGITIPGSVVSIEQSAFSHCAGLTSITIPGSVASIGDYGFVDCSSLSSAYFYGNAPELGGGVFDGCASGFTVYYTPESTGFTNPWHGYPTVLFYPCTLEIYPRRLSKALNTVMQLQAFVIRGDENASFSKATTIDWGTYSVETMLQAAFGKRIIIALVLVNGKNQQAGDIYEVTVGDCRGELPVKMF